MFRHRKRLVIGLPALFTALLAGHWSPVWLIGVGAVIALPLWLAAAWYMACAASSRIDPSGRFPDLARSVSPVSLGKPRSSRRTAQVRHARRRPEWQAGDQLRIV